MQLGDGLQWAGIVGCGVGFAYLLVRVRQGRQALILAQERLALLNRATRELRADAIRDKEKTDVNDPETTQIMTPEELEEAKRGVP